MWIKSDYLLLFLIIGSLFMGCEGESDPAPAVVLPTDLSIAVQQDDTNPARVTVSFSAQKANFYKVYFGDQQDETAVTTQAKTLDHTYSSAGTFTIRVQAHATDDAFITASEEVTILPTNLALEVQPVNGTLGKVRLTISADNANFFTILFGDEANATPVQTEEKVVEHTYATSGTYTIQVKAHATEDTFITQSTEVTVDVDNVQYPIGYTTPESYAGMNLVWQDEFNGTALNTSDWTFETGTGSNGWGNNELQYYRPENTSVQDGFLTITAKKESFGGREYTSSRIITKGKQEFQYGRIDIRAVLPQGQGIWPALWMLGSNISSVGWPASGEIDIMELVGGKDNTGATRDNTTHGTIHWSHDGNYANYGGPYKLNSGIFADEFHVFSIEWTPTAITWLVDDEEFHTVDITPAQLSEFHQKFFFIFNVAVGGNWPGSPDATTQFPQQMIVDYVRVFQKQ